MSAEEREERFSSVLHLRAETAGALKQHLSSTCSAWSLKHPVTPLKQVLPPLGAHHVLLDLTQGIYAR